MQIKVSELKPIAVDYLVAKLQCIRLSQVPLARQLELHQQLQMQKGGAFSPTSNWAQGGPILHSKRITTHDFDGIWMALIFERNSFGVPLKRETPSKSIFGQFQVNNMELGLDPLDAGMRCYIASEMGEVVEVPDELLL